MSHQQPQDDRLIEQARSGDRRAQQELWRIHRRWVAAIVLAHRPRTIEVEDLMQDVAVKFVDKLDTLRDVAAFRPWMRQIIINACRGAARGKKTVLRLEAESMREDGVRESVRWSLEDEREAAVEQGAARRDAAEHAFARLMTLPPEYREPMLLRCVRELSYQQISDILDLPVTTIETRLARARRMLREELEGLGEGASSRSVEG